jgi:hypothetical protein
MRQSIRNYFLIFGNDIESDSHYWERDYVELWQIILGIIALPIFILFWIWQKTFGIKIH